MTIDTQLLERRYRLLGAGTPLFYNEPVHIVRGEGVWLYGADGKKIPGRVQQRAQRGALPSARG